MPATMPTTRGPDIQVATAARSTTSRSVVAGFGVNAEL